MAQSRMRLAPGRITVGDEVWRPGPACWSVVVDIAPAAGEWLAVTDDGTYLHLPDDAPLHVRRDTSAAGPSLPQSAATAVDAGAPQAAPLGRAGSW